MLNLSIKEVENGYLVDAGDHSRVHTISKMHVAITPEDLSALILKLADDDKARNEQEVARCAING